MKPLVSVVVPLHNEGENVPRLAERVTQVFEGLPEYDYECLYVNDGSRDGTRAALDVLGARDSHVRPLHLSENRGQSAALYAGMTRARGDYILTIDGDLQNDPCDFPQLLELLHKYDCVCGYRTRRNDALVRRISSRLANAVRNALFRDGIRDAGCGTKGFRRCCVEHFVPFNGLHRFFPVFIRAAGLSLTECPVTHHPRTHGVSKYGVHNRLWRGLFDLVGVAWLRKRHVTFRVEGEEKDD